MRVTHLITDLSVGGAELMLYRLLSRMDRQSYLNQVVSLTDVGPVGEMIRAKGISVTSLGMTLGMPTPGAFWRLRNWLRRERPQILQSWLYHSDLLGLLAARAAGVPKVVWNVRCADMDLSHYRRLTRWVVRVCSHLSPLPSAVIVNSSAGRQYHVGIGYRPRRWELIPNGFDLESYRPDPIARGMLRAELGMPENVILIGLVARFDPMKDHLTFLRAASLFHGQRPEVRFLLCGRGVDGTNDRLAGWVGELGLDDVVHMLGERRDIPLVTAALDVATSSSITEGFPTTIGEAMACGVPCVATDVGDSAQILGDTGRIVPPRNPRALADAWLQLVDSDPDDRVEVGLAARRRVEKHFGIDIIVRRYEGLYHELAGQGRD